MIPDDEYFLSAINPVANIDQRDAEARAISLLARPELQRARMVAGILWRGVMEYPARAQMDRFDAMLEEYVFHYALRAVASDSQYPNVVRFMTPAGNWLGHDVPGSRWAGDSPDFIYRMIPVNHGSRYEIHGRASSERPPFAYFALMGDNTASPVTLGLVDSLGMKIEADGRFVLTLDDTPANGRPNHIQLLPGSHQIWVRDALGDWQGQSPNALRVNLLDAPKRDPLSDEQIAGIAAKSLLDGVYYSYYIARSTTSKMPNTAAPPAGMAALGAMASQYMGSLNVVLAEDEALIVTASAAGARFRNAVLHDQFMLSLDYWGRMGSLNMDQMAADEDGLFTYVIAHRDPGVQNWLDTGGLGETILAHRWQAFGDGVASEAPSLGARLVKFDELEKELPKGVRRVDPISRQQQLSARAAGYRTRFAS